MRRTMRSALIVGGVSRDLRRMEVAPRPRRRVFRWLREEGLIEADLVQDMLSWRHENWGRNIIYEYLI